MRTASANNERPGSRSVHKLAEKLAKSDGVDFDEWIGEAIAEYAQDLGVAPQNLSERERLEAIEDRIDRHVRAVPAPRRPFEREPAPAPQMRRESVRTAPESDTSSRYERDRFDEDDAPPARPLARASANDRLEQTIQDIERRAERNEGRTAKALESLTELVASRGFERSRLEDAVAGVEKRAQRNEERTAAAIESLQHLVASRGGERERLVQAVAQVEMRAQRNAERTAKALESISQAVAARDEERERLEAAVERVNKRNEESEARAARAFESLSAMVSKSAERRPPAAEPAHAFVAESVDDPVAERFSQLSKRAAVNSVPRAGGDGDDEALALVAERLARRRRQKGETPARAVAPAPELADAFGDLRSDLRLLADKVDRLSDGGVGAAALDALRAQTREVERALIVAGEKVAGAERMQAQVGGLAEKVERLAAAQPASAEMASALKALADAHAKVERDDPAKALKAVERQLDDLGARVEAAARRPAPDSRALEDLARRIEAVRTAVERQARPEAKEFVAALGALNDKLDAAVATGSQSAANLSAVAAMVARLEEEVRRPTAVSLDAKPIEDLARRIEAVRVAVERQARPETGEFVAALGALNDKLDAAAASGSQSAANLSSLAAMVARLEAEAGRPTAVSLDPRPIEDLARRIDGVQGRLTPKVDELQTALDTLTRKLDRTSPGEASRLDAQLADIRARLDRPAFVPQMEAVEAALRRMAAKVEETAARPTPVAFDSQPLEDLVRRIDGAHGRLGPKVDSIHTALGELSARIDRPTRAAAEIGGIEEALRRLGAQVETALARPGAFDPQALEALARRIDAVRSAAEANGALSPQVARLEAGLTEIRARLDRPAYVPQIEAVDATLRRLAAKFEEAAARPTTVSLDARPIEDLARRIESVRASLETTPSLAPQVERLETALGVVSDKLDRAAAPVDAQGINATLAQMNRQLEEAFRRPPEFEREQIDALAAQVEAVRETVERQTQHFGGAEAALREAVERIERPGTAPELVVLVNAVKALATKIERLGGFDQVRLETLFAEWAERLARQGGAQISVKPLADAVTALGDRIDRMRPGEEPALHGPVMDLLDRLDGLAGRDSRLEGALRDVGERLGGVEQRLLAPAKSGDGWAHIEFAVRDLTGKVADLRAASDVRAVEQDVRALHEKIDDLADIGLHARAAPAAPPDALLEPLLDIQERLDKLASMRTTPPALDDALAEFADQMDALRAAREEAAREAATVADLRADHATFDRRMDARFSGVQDVLERLVDRIARLEREPAPEARTLVAAPPSFSTRPAMPDIPDRETPMRAPPPPAPEMPVIAPPPRLREEPAVSKSAALSAHIAAARRKASAVAESEERMSSAAASGGVQGFGRRAQALLSVNSRPVLLTAAGALTLLTCVAVYELSGRTPVHKSEIEAPVAPPTALGEASPVDDTPTGALASAPKVIAAPLPALSPTPAPSPQAAKPSQTLVAAVPAGVGPALIAAAANGDLGAEVEIAQRYLEGRTVPRDPKVAADWLQAAADAGSPFASYRLGALYEKGVGVARDAARARTLYIKAADAGNARAMHNLAVLYAQDGGQGKPDYPVALDWFRRAGVYGVRDSQFNLGVLYGRGLGGGQDLAQSWFWFSLAARQGDTDAAHKRDEVAIRMDGKAMGAAKKLLDDFKGKTPDPAVNDPPPAPPAAADAAPAKKEVKTPA